MRLFPKAPRLFISLATTTTTSTAFRTQLQPFSRSFSATPLIMSSVLTVHNSLKPGAPVPFEPKQDGHVSWYTCGPTVYDISHLGHARNYLSTDIIRRILMHYFGYKVNFVMNITDVDDKIILKARQRRLLELERAKSYSPVEIRKLGLRALLAYSKAHLPLLHPEGNPELDEDNYAERRDAAYKSILEGGTLSGHGKPGDEEAKLRMQLRNMDAATQALRINGNVFDGAEEVLLPYLDSLYKETVDTADQSMFTDLTQEMEREFTNDMRALNILPPDSVTRVTEYVPQIVSFIERLVGKGFAYESDGSVYFDISAFEKAGNQYARLRPDSKNDEALREEGEGSLSKNVTGKKSAGDFGLWKKSRPGEPYWPSPWGNGRPGWHIECSVMASDKLGEQMDIHSGGIDLAFPHHDNELAQSEAYFHNHGQHTWVRHFLHMGHLSISGSKMSKSLKNFQTIRDALATTYTARNMRIVFLMGRWNDGVEVSPGLRAQATSWESTIDNFFTNIKSKLAEAEAAASSAINALKLTEEKPASGIAEDLARAKKDLDTALKSSFDTPAALQVILRLVREANIHMSNPGCDLDAVNTAAKWVTKIVGILGLDANASPPYGGFGWAPARTSTSSGRGGADPKAVAQTFGAVLARVKSDVKALDISNTEITDLLEQSVEPEYAELEKANEGDPERLSLPYIRAVSRIRDSLRQLVTSSAHADKKAAILDLSDRIRNYDLTDLGVQLDDQPDKPSLIKFVPTDKLIAARDEKAALAAERAQKKEEARKAREAADAEKWEKAKTKPSDMFRDDQKYLAWDDDGIPTKTKEGEELPKSQAKKLRKEWEKQKKLHEEYLAKMGEESV